MVTVKKVFILINLLLLAGGVYYTVRIFYKVAASEMTYLPIVAKNEGPERLVNRQTARPRSDYQSIIQRDLFNTVTPAEHKEAIVDVETLKPTKLDLKLWGTVAAENGQAAYAVIEDLKTRKQNLYRAGDSVANATVKHILREKIILNVNGKDEILEMAPIPLSGAPLKSSMEVSTTGRRITIERSLIENAARDIGSLMKQARITPHSENGQPVGLQVTGIRPGSVFRKIGLRNGDVLESVAGNSITSVESMVALYQNLKSADTVEVQVKRRNRLHTITYDIR
jgi:general secretion pathway protein C